MIEVIYVSAPDASDYESSHRFRWKCASCGHTSLSKVTNVRIRSHNRSILSRLFPKKLLSITRDCCWCEVPNNLTLRIHYNE